MLNKDMFIKRLVDTLPSVVTKAMPFVPNALSQVALERVLNVFFKQELANGALGFMQQHWVHITVRDIGFDFYVSVQKKQGKPRLLVRHQAIDADVFLAGDMDDLFLLMTQRIDPDTLFFRRKLTLRGDTELGLALKNFLDTIELHTRLPHQLHQWSLAVANEVQHRQSITH